MTIKTPTYATKKAIETKWLKCHSECCKGRETLHYFNRVGMKGRLYVCRECGAERTT